ncbi:MAG: helix-turn-helix domain-containing protein [Flavobacteriaceae bacterium]|nr:helix-turn-helix domain-containing protein [Flavobacteriaceae bacterium]
MKILTEDTPEIQNLFQKMEQFTDKVKSINEHFKPVIEGEIYLQGEDVCKILHISKRTLQQYRDDKILPYIQLNGKIIYQESDIYKLLEDNYIQ